MTTQIIPDMAEFAEVRYESECPAKEIIKKATKSKDFIRDIKDIRDWSRHVPYSLLIYNDILGLGTCTNNRDVKLDFQEYSDSALLSCIDKALSLLKKPVRIVDKTKKNKTFLARLEPRTSMDWIYYSTVTQLLRETDDRPCTVQRQLESQGLKNDLYALTQDKGKVILAHFKIEEYMTIGKDGTVKQGIRCTEKDNRTYDGTIEDIEKICSEQQSSVMTVRQPLMYCSASCCSSPKPCIAEVFGRVYAKKTGIEGSSFQLK